jgi:hypothetical protein
MEHRGAGVLLAESQVGRKRERIEAAELLELGKLEAGITVEFHALSFDSGRELKVFRRTTSLEDGRLASGDEIVDAGLGESLEREVG